MIEYNTRQLISAMKQLKKSVSKRSTLPVLAGVLFHERGLSTTNLDVATTATLAPHHTHHDPVSPRFVLPFATLEKSLSPTKSETVRFEPVYTEPDKGDPHISHVDVWQANRSIRMQVIGAAKDYPELPNTYDSDYPRIDLALSAEQVAQLKAAVIPYAATDDSRPTLSGVLMERSDNGTVTFCAADGFRLGVMDVPYTGEEFEKIVIPATSLKMLPAKTEVTITGVSEKPGQVYIHWDDGDTAVSFLSRTIPGHFPDYRQIIPQGPYYALVVDADTVQEADKLPADNDIIRLYSDGRVTIYTDDGVVTWHEAVVSDAPAGYALNTTYLKGALAAHEVDGTITINVPVPVGDAPFGNFACRIDTGNCTAVIMPMVIGKEWDTQPAETTREKVAA